MVVFEAGNRSTTSCARVFHDAHWCSMSSPFDKSYLESTSSMARQTKLRSDQLFSFKILQLC